MKKTASFLIALLMVTILCAQSPFLPNVELKTIEGLPTSSNNIIEPGVVTILVFWKSCNKSCQQSLDAMHELWQESLEGQGVKMVTVCVDGNGAMDHVRPYVNGNDWDFETYIDVNCELKRALNVNTLPCTILLDQSQNLICRHEGFCTGSETMLCEKVQTQLYTAMEY